MKKLDITKAYYLGDLEEFHRGVVFDYLLNIDYTFKTTRKIDFQKIDTDYIFYAIDEWEWYTKIEFVEKEIDLEVVNALTLFEPQFKQGDKVLVSDNKWYWVDGEFITEYKDQFVVKTYNSIIGRKHIKPYEEEIKVGDWVYNSLNDSFYKKKLHDIHNSERKITNPQLIELLNNEL